VGVGGGVEGNKELPVRDEEADAATARPQGGGRKNVMSEGFSLGRKKTGDSRKGFQKRGRQGGKSLIPRGEVLKVFAERIIPLGVTLGKCHDRI